MPMQEPKITDLVISLPLLTSPRNCKVLPASVTSRKYGSIPRQYQGHRGTLGVIQQTEADTEAVNICIRIAIDQHQDKVSQHKQDQCKDGRFYNITNVYFGITTCGKAVAGNIAAFFLPYIKWYARKNTSMPQAENRLQIR